MRFIVIMTVLIQTFLKDISLSQRLKTVSIFIVIMLMIGMIEIMLSIVKVVMNDVAYQVIMQKRKIMRNSVQLSVPLIVGTQLLKRVNQLIQMRLSVVKIVLVHIQTQILMKVLMVIYTVKIVFVTMRKKRNNKGLNIGLWDCNISQPKLL